MKIDPRRENGITVRFLAETIINDFIGFKGVNKFVEYLTGSDGINKSLFLGLSHYFFFHLEDYGVNDKSEIDLILWNDDVILPIEIKCFTDANSPDVKRELIRNYFHVEKIRDSRGFCFDKRQEIYPVLLYSNAYQQWKRKSNNDYNYFNKDFLLKKGKDQSVEMDNWERGGYPISKEYCSMKDFDEKIQFISKNLCFITWDDVYKIHFELNNKGFFDKKLEELGKLEDIKQDSNGIRLVSAVSTN